MNHRVDHDDACVTDEQDAVSHDILFADETADLVVIGLLEQVVDLETEECRIHNEHDRCEVSDG